MAMSMSVPAPLPMPQASLTSTNFTRCTSVSSAFPPPTCPIPKSPQPPQSERTPRNLQQHHTDLDIG
ncbi:hypothetical protein N7501_009478 [Penicillium viridicatum]|nr:hypothetical protein N7501_009478 [Penicillium viridicatum]